MCSRLERRLKRHQELILRTCDFSGTVRPPSPALQFRILLLHQRVHRHNLAQPKLLLYQKVLYKLHVSEYVRYVVRDEPFSCCHPQLDHTQWPARPACCSRGTRLPCQRGSARLFEHPEFLRCAQGLVCCDGGHHTSRQAAAKNWCVCPIAATLQTACLSRFVSACRAAGCCGVQAALPFAVQIWTVWTAQTLISTLPRCGTQRQQTIARLKSRLSECGNAE